MIQFKENAQTDRWKDKRTDTLFYRALPATARGPISQNNLERIGNKVYRDHFFPFEIIQLFPDKINKKFCHTLWVLAVNKVVGGLSESVKKGKFVTKFFF